MIGLFSFILFIAFTLSLNLALAHYREVSGSFIEEAGAIVVTRLLEAPLELGNIKSWLFFGIGVLFSWAAFIDAIFLDDPYPGFGQVDRRVRKAHDEYTAIKEELVEELTGIRDEAVEAMEEAKRDIGVRRSEHDAIVTHRGQFIKRFKLHIEHLNRAVNKLLTTYRNENIKTREKGAPKHFSNVYKVDAPAVDLELTGYWDPQELKAAITTAQSTLAQHIRDIHDEYVSAVQEYQRIDDLIGEDGDGTKAKAST